jgi:hypothetical protein
MVPGSKICCHESEKDGYMGLEQPLFFSSLSCIRSIHAKNRSFQIVKTAVLWQAFSFVAIVLHMMAQ